MTAQDILQIPDSFLEAVLDKEPPQGFTRNFYKYPARFSPRFARAAIETFSKQGDLILDPFMGSGTTLVEAMLTGRSAIGTDINPLAHLVAEAKTTVLTDEDFKTIEQWMIATLPKLNLHKAIQTHNDWAEKGYQKDVPWRIRKSFALLLDELPALNTEVQQSFVRCVLLKTGQWALDCKERVPSVNQFRAVLQTNMEEALIGANELRIALGKRKSKIVCLNIAAESLDAQLWKEKIHGRASLIVTSPPYPGVNVLYHRWQIGGRKATPVPYWIANRLDGHGRKYYTMGGTTGIGLREYFLSIEVTFQRLRRLLRDDGFVIQLIGFSNVEEQLPKYLAAMEGAGFVEAPYISTSLQQERLQRQVPSRRWYATFKGQIPSSQEILLVHKKSS